MTTSAAEGGATFGKRAALDQLRLTFDHMFAASTALDEKLQSMLTTTGLIVSIAGFIQITLPRVRSSPIFWPALGVVLALFATLVVTILISLRARPVQYPISSDWVELSEKYFNESEDAVLKRLVADQLYAQEILNEICDQKATALNVASVLLGLTVMALLLAFALGTA